MRTKVSPPWIPLERVDSILQLDPLLALVGLALASFLVYRLLLRKAAPHRHTNLKRLFINLLGHTALFLTLYLTYLGLRQANIEPAESLNRISSYIGLLAIISGATVFVKTTRILVFEYLFLGHMREGVPLLLVNLSTLLMSMVIAAWMATEIFGVQLAPLLATSAVLSLVMGLALQDTLGNLFAGVAMQFDKPYGIGDWIEVSSGTTTWTGQVFEISWRATVLVGFGDELITIPNRVIAQAEISNFSLKTRPILRRQIFRIAPEADPARVRAALMEAARRVDSIAAHPAPMVLVTETHESWIPYKLIYYVDDYGAQYLLADQIIEQVRAELKKEGIPLATNRVLLNGPFSHGA